jgi:hypothetical protein
LHILRRSGEYKSIVAEKVTGQDGKHEEVDDPVLLCPPPLPNGTPREHDKESYGPEGQQNIILLCIFVFHTVRYNLKL